MIEGYCEDDVFGVTSLKQYKGRFVLVQDSQFTLRLFDLDKMVNSGLEATT